LEKRRCHAHGAAARQLPAADVEIRNSSGRAVQHQTAAGQQDIAQRRCAGHLQRAPADGKTSRSDQTRDGSAGITEGDGRTEPVDDDGVVGGGKQVGGPVARILPGNAVATTVPLCGDRISREQQPLLQCLEQSLSGEWDGGTLPAALHACSRTRVCLKGDGASALRRHHFAP
jgi:hypothetical protein